MPSWSTPIELLRPGRIEFGMGVIDGLPGLLRERGWSRPFVIADRFNGSRLGVLGLGEAVPTFDSVKPEPDVENLNAAIAAAEAARPDVIIGFGGGSAMDVAKLVSVLMGSGLTVHDVVGPERAPPRSVGLVQIPTTSGTGSEAGTRSLIADPVTHGKLAVQSRHMLADLAVVDPGLTLTLPEAVSAASGVDALAHCTEAFTSLKAHPSIDLFALEGIRLAGANVGATVSDGADPEARSAMALASLYGGFCLGPVNTTAGHAIAYPLGTRFGLPHGLTCALIFPHTLAANAPFVPEKTGLILKALGGQARPDSDYVFETAYAFCHSVGIDMRLRTHGVTEADVAPMAREAFAIRRLLDNNPNPLTVDQIEAIYAAAL